MQTFKSLINKQTNLFISAVKQHADIAKNIQHTRISNAFPIFLPDQHFFYEQKEFEKYMENAIWYYLVNEVLKARFLFDDCVNKPIKCEWTHMPRMLASASYVEDNEMSYPVEFKVHMNEKVVGYRYTNVYFSKDKLDNIFENYGIDELVVIYFYDYNILKPTGLLTVHEKLRYVPLESFYLTYFSSNEYEEYIDSVKKAVVEAYKYMGLETIPNLTVRDIPFLLDQEEAHFLASKGKIREYNHIKPYDELSADIHKKLEHKYKQFLQSDLAEMDKNFYDNQRYLALIGSMDYAHSFITSEYLYNTLRDNNIFDLTSIVCGYLKAVEQLLYSLMKYSLENTSLKLWILANRMPKEPPTDKPSDWLTTDFDKNHHVRFTKDNESYFTTTFRALVNLLCYGEAKKMWSISEGAVDRISTYLSIYCDECRNEHFHKDNIDSVEEIETIRKNTLLLFYYILGGFKLTGSQFGDMKYLGILDREYEKMYRSLMSVSCGGDYFLLTFGNDQPQLFALPMNQENPDYDRNGMVSAK